MAPKKPAPRRLRVVAAAAAPELTVAKVASTWKTLAALVASTVVIGSAALWILSTQFARVADVKRIEETQVETRYLIKAKDIEVGGLNGNVQEIKGEIGEIRREQRQTSENLIRLMERFAVKPVEAR